MRRLSLIYSRLSVSRKSIVTWLWGGFFVDNPTLNQFFSLHHLLLFIIVTLIMLHLVALHQHGSNNPKGIDVKSPNDTIPFHPYYAIKDCVGFGVYFIIFAYFIFYEPNYLGHPDNYIPANPLGTPAHMVPEWYFLPFYAILRAVPSKLGGVLLMFGSIFVLFLLPWLDSSKVRSSNYRPMYRIAFWLFVVDCVLLGYLGGQPAAISRFAACYYFFHFLALPLKSKYEKPLPFPEEL